MSAFLLQAVLVSLSGVMAPGPLSAATVAYGQRWPHAGALTALGHALVEFPLMAVVLLGLTTWFDTPAVRPAISLAGGLVLLWMGAGTLWSARRLAAPQGEPGAGTSDAGARGASAPGASVRGAAGGSTSDGSAAGGATPSAAAPWASALRTGLLLTGGNPYLLVWWLTVGAALLVRAADFGGAGIGAFAAVHWLCDLVWLWFLSAAVFGGGRWLGPRFQRGVLLGCGFFLLVVGVQFVAQGAVVGR